MAEPNQVWAGDITYIAPDEGWLFLAVVIDLFGQLTLASQSMSRLWDTDFRGKVIWRSVGGVHRNMEVQE